MQIQFHARQMLHKYGKKSITENANRVY